MRPGITGKAQVTVRNTVSWDERIAVDNQYISSFNIWRDIRILFKTLGKIFDFKTFIWKQVKITERNLTT